MSAAGSRSGAGEVRVLAPAKVNLDLELLGRRPDGYHELRTTMLALDLWDELSVRRTAGAGIELRVDGPQASADIPTDDRNLAAGAAGAALELARGRGLVEDRDGLALHLTKHIPSRAGLGGGSSDAAGAMLGCARVLGLDPSDPVLVEALARLGSDTAFFLSARETGLARCEGRGERVQPLEGLRVPWWFVVVTPDLEVSTSRVFSLVPKAGDACERARGPFLDVESFTSASIEEARARLFNRLEDSAVEAEPGLARWRDALDAAGLDHAVLCGSGASYFAMFADRLAAEQALGALAIEREARDLGLRGEWVLRAAGAGVKSS